MTKSDLKQSRVAGRVYHARATETSPVTSRRALLGTLAMAPAAMSAFPARAAPEPSPPAHADVPVTLRRSRKGRSDSRFRYHNAESFFAGVERGIRQPRGDDLYRIGIVLQLALSSHLLDVGFEDRWCARHIGLDLAKSLAYANATGLSHDCPDLARLAVFLSPYGKFRNADRGTSYDCPFSAVEMHQLTCALLDRVHEVTGHPRPRGWECPLLGRGDEKGEVRRG